MVKAVPKNKCGFCSKPADMTVKAPYATPIPCCDRHQGIAWQLGGQAVLKNKPYLHWLASPLARQIFKVELVVRPVVIRTSLQRPRME